jgi:hypothetical protein
MYAHSPLRIHIRKLTSMSTFERPNRQIFEIDEVITDISLSIGTSATVESTAPRSYGKLNPDLGGYRDDLITTMLRIISRFVIYFLL